MERIMMNSEEYVLENEDISRAVETVESYLYSNNVERSEVLRTVLAVEDILLTYMDRFGSLRFKLKTGKKYGNVRIELGILCNEFDPFADAENDEAGIMHNLMINAGLDPSWTFRNGANRILFLIKAKKKVSVIVQILGAFIAGAAFGLISLQTKSSVISDIFDKCS